MAAIGEKCPLFNLQNQRGEDVDIETLIGKKILIIYFYPKDDTPGCTKEACSFRDNYEDFKDLGCEVIGISSDSVEAHRKFANKHRLSFTLLSDPNKSVRKAFNVPTNFLGFLDGRVTYIIDESGIVQGVFNSQLNPVGHIEAALKIVKRLKA